MGDGRGVAEAFDQGRAGTGSKVARCVLGFSEDRHTPGRDRGAHRGHRRRAEKSPHPRARRRREHRRREPRGRHAGMGIGDAHRGGGRGFRRLHHRHRQRDLGARIPTQISRSLRRHPHQRHSRFDDLGGPHGAKVQWTAMGEGLVDWKAYFNRWAAAPPTVPSSWKSSPASPARSNTSSPSSGRNTRK